MNLRDMRFDMESPYPDIRVRCKNKFYARMMLDNVGGMNSEMSAASSYFYGALVSEGYEEVSRAFHGISIVEMHHLEIFSALAMDLGEDPRLWTQKGNGKIYWSPSYNCYPYRISAILHDAVQGEKLAIEKYCEQARIIRDDNIRQNLLRIIEDEELHIKILTELENSNQG